MGRHKRNEGPYMMRRKIIYTALISLMLNPCVFADTSQERPEAPVAPSETDLKIIAAMEDLELMDLVENMDLIKDLEFIIEEDQNEKKN